MKKGLLVSSLVAVASAASAQSLSASSVRRVAIRRIGAMEESVQKFISANGIIGVARLGSVVVALLNLERVSDIASPMRLLSQPQPDASRFVQIPEAAVQRGF